MLRARLDAQQGRQRRGALRPAGRHARRSRSDPASEASRSVSSSRRSGSASRADGIGEGGELGRFPVGGLALHLGLAFWSFEGLGLGESRR